MEIIGHRGASGNVLENTAESLTHAAQLGVDAIEFDIRKTKDNHLVVFHDANLNRLANHPGKISRLTLSQLQHIKLIGGMTIPTLDTVLKCTGNTPLIIEIKAAGCAQLLSDALYDQANRDIRIGSFKRRELKLIKRLEPTLSTYFLEKNHPIEAISVARKLRLQGVGLNFWILNPLTYWLANHYKLNLYVWTVNNRLTFWFIRLFYPRAGICTDNPDKFIK
ncbi:MAG: glycerophosphodiester phosphodiesterase family protein [Candidatus Saccharibacteria bacterium]|nr:glycerophosphodiester phosphodiesterase family protein [Candidatus Saccharibacteria bacterium]